MAVLDPEVPVECDRCGEIIAAPMRAMARALWSLSSVQSHLKAEGWTLPHGIYGETICPNCSREQARLEAHHGN
jgi:hypothetical protein